MRSEKDNSTKAGQYILCMRLFVRACCSRSTWFHCGLIPTIMRRLNRLPLTVEKLLFLRRFGWSVQSNGHPTVLRYLLVITTSNFIKKHKMPLSIGSATGLNMPNAVTQNKHTGCHWTTSKHTARRRHLLDDRLSPRRTDHEELVLGQGNPGYDRNFHCFQLTKFFQVRLHPGESMVKCFGDKWPRTCWSLH